MVAIIQSLSMIWQSSCFHPHHHINFLFITTQSFPRLFSLPTRDIRQRSIHPLTFYSDKPQTGAENLWTRTKRNTKQCHVKLKFYLTSEKKANSIYLYISRYRYLYISLHDCFCMYLFALEWKNRVFWRSWTRWGMVLAAII